MRLASHSQPNFDAPLATVVGLADRVAVGVGVFFSGRPNSSGVKLPLPGTSAIASLLGFNVIALEVQRIAPTPPKAHYMSIQNVAFRRALIAMSTRDVSSFVT